MTPILSFCRWMCKLSKIPVFLIWPILATANIYRFKLSFKIPSQVKFMNLQSHWVSRLLLLTRLRYRRAGEFFPGHSSAKYYQQWYATFERKWVITEWPKRHQVSGPSWNIHQGQAATDTSTIIGLKSSINWLSFGKILPTDIGRHPNLC